MYYWRDYRLKDTMTHVEQHKMIIELMDYQRKMGRYESEEFDMYVKRDKDDEDLDIPSQKKLIAMHEKYAQRKGKTL